LFLLIFNCIALFFFKKWFGPAGFLIISSFFLLSTCFGFIYILMTQQLYSVYFFLDFGRFFFIYDLLDTHLIFIFDTLSLVTGLLVLLLTLFAQYFGIEYMYREAFILRLIYLLNFFATSVIFLFFVYDFFLILIVWELIGLFSLLLVNFYATRIYTIKAAFKTFIFSRFSDMFIFICFFFLVMLINSTDLSIVFLKIPFYVFFNVYFFNIGFNLLNLFGVFLTIAAAVKAAQFSFHV